MSATQRVMRSRPNKGPGGDVFARTTVIRVDREDNSTSRQLEPIDEWATSPFASVQLATPYDPFRLTQIIERSSILQPCIDAYVTNTVQTGWEPEPVARGGKMDPGELMELQSFIDHANSEQSLVGVMADVIRDRESIGYGFLEGIRDASGAMSLLRHAPAIYTRLCPKNTTDVLVTYTIQRGRRTVTVQEWRKFRRFVQLIGGQIVYFREWGDPRKLNRNTGYFEGEEGYVAGADATEILHFKLPSNEPYGVPRWINQLPSIIGSREAEEVNMHYFEDNTVPPIMLTVSGGRLTAHSYQELTKAIQSQNIGKDRQNRIMIIEATGDSDSLDGKGTPVKLEVEKLTDARQSDSLFGTYDRDNQAKVRQSWRIPAGVLGQSSEQNYANAQIAIFTADSQVFGPARCEIDEIIQKQVVAGSAGLGLKTVKLTSRIPSISSPDMTVKTLTALNVMGAVTPRTAQHVINKVLQIELTEYPQKGDADYEDWMDKPIQLSKVSTSTTDGSAGNTHDEQAAKTDEIKKLEQEGDPGFKRPENGAEGEVIKE